MKKIYGNTVVALFTMLLMTACVDEQGKEDKEEVAYKVPVETVSIAFQNITNTYKTTAILEAQAESKVVNKVTGMIEEVLVDEGDFVKKGQVLAVIDAERYQLELERTAIELESATAEFNRSQPVDGKELISAKDLEKLGFMVKSRANEKKLAQIKVRDSKVTAPISGIVANKMIKVGNMTSASESEMFHIVALDTLQGVVYLPETEINNIGKGQVAGLVFPSDPSNILPAQVAKISPIVDAKSGTFKVTLEVTNNNNLLKPGMFAKVALVLDTRENAKVVPQKSLIVTDTGTSLFVVEDGKAKKLFVETGYEENGFVEIISDLADDAQIVVVGQHSLKPDSDVTVINLETPAESDEESDSSSLASTN